MNFNKAKIVILLILILSSCSNRRTSKEEDTPEILPPPTYEDYLKDKTKTTENKTKPMITKIDREYDYSVYDSLKFYMNKQTFIPKELYKDIFGDELSDIDNVLVKEIRKSVQSLNPIITVFQTVESDTRQEFIDLHFFNNKWNLQKSYSIKYFIHYDLFSKEYVFLNDSTMKSISEHGFSYESDSAVRTSYILRIDQTKFFDTLKIERDTII